MAIITPLKKVFNWQLWHDKITPQTGGTAQKILTVPAPAGGGTASVTIEDPDTIITFSGSFAGNCTLQINAPTSAIGDKLYVMFNSTLLAPIAVSSAGDLDWVPCGTPGDPLIIVPGPTVVLCIFDGTKFIALPLCI